MGSGKWDPKDWVTYASVNNYAGKSTAEIYSNSTLVNELDPKGVKIRESRDSVDNPTSSAIIVALDVTGSMQSVLDSMARKGLNTLVTEVYNRKPVSDPHIMCMGIGDVEAGDKAPLQITQFEADIRIAQQLEKLYLEGGGGGNQYESYALAWYFAAKHTAIDCFEKRGKKGYLFTIGDEGPTPYLRAEDIKRVFGDDEECDSTIKLHDLLTLVSRQWEVFHVIVEEGSHARSHKEVFDQWGDLLGQRCIRLSDHKKIAEVIVSTLQICEGEAADTVTESWDGTTSLAVNHAVKGLAALNKRNHTSSGVMTL
jgi:hypothetical protein